MSGTTLPTIDDVGFAQRIARFLPSGWAGDDAIQDGVAGAFLQAKGGGLAEVLATLQYLLRATRLTTATSPELDLASQDFFGDALPRQPGQSDASFSAAIIANLFRSAATRPAISAALTTLTGLPPRMLEPWNIFDTGHWDDVSYWDVDSAQFPARWAAPELRYQGFIETTSPAIPALGPNAPILGWDTTAYWDVPGYFFGEIGLNPAQAVDSVISALKAEGTTVWVKLVTPAQAGSTSLDPATGLTTSNATFNSVQVSWTAPVVGVRPLSYLVQFRPTGTLTWLTGATTGATAVVLVGLIPVTQYDFRVVTSNSIAPPSTSSVVQATTLKQPPGPAQSLTATTVTATAITVQWSPPSTGTLPFNYTVQYRVTGTTPFSSLPVGSGSTAVTIVNLLPSTAYDIEVVTSNT